MPSAPTPDPTESGAADPIDTVAALGDPNRRRLYEHVVEANGWVGRDAAAEASGLRRGITAHHLDKLAELGLLEVDYQRLSGRSGPGAGRPAKVYRRARRDVDVSLPPRDYALPGRLLADALVAASTTGEDPGRLLDEAARREGIALGAAIAGGADDGGPGAEAAMAALEARGFEPTQDQDGTILLRNCPFHELARSHTSLICGMNHCLLTAAMQSAGVTLDASLEPHDDMCCVRLHHRPIGDRPERQPGEES